MYEIFREFLDHEFVAGLRTLKRKNLYKPKNLTLFQKKLVFFPALISTQYIRRQECNEGTDDGRIEETAIAYGALCIASGAIK